MWLTCVYSWFIFSGSWDWIADYICDICIIVLLLWLWFHSIRNRCIGVVPRTLSDIGCVIVTLVKLQVFRVSSGWWIGDFCITNHMFAVMCEFVVSVTTWCELVMTWGRVYSPSRGLRLRAVSLRYSFELWSSCTTSDCVTCLRARELVEIVNLALLWCSVYCKLHRECCS